MKAIWVPYCLRYSTMSLWAATSMGRVLLAELSEAEATDVFERSDRAHATPHTVGSAAELLDRLAAVRDQGWALVDQELTFFEGSIRDNLTLWDGSIAQSQLVQATKDALDPDNVFGAGNQAFAGDTDAAARSYADEAEGFDNEWD